MLLVPPAVFADVIASRRLPSPAIGLAGSVVLLTVKVAARANPDITRSNSGNAIAVSANRRFRSAMDSPPARHIQAFGKFPPVLTNSGVVFGRLSQYSDLLSIPMSRAFAILRLCRCSLQKRGEAPWLAGAVWRRLAIGGNAGSRILSGRAKREVGTQN